MESAEQDLRGHRGSITHGPGVLILGTVFALLCRGSVERRDRKVVESRKGVKQGRVGLPRRQFWILVLALRAVEKFRMKGECEDERGECEDVVGG